MFPSRISLKVLGIHLASNIHHRNPSPQWGDNVGRFYVSYPLSRNIRSGVYIKLLFFAWSLVYYLRMCLRLHTKFRHSTLNIRISYLVMFVFYSFFGSFFLMCLWCLVCGGFGFLISLQLLPSNVENADKCVGTA